MNVNLYRLYYLLGLKAKQPIIEETQEIEEDDSTSAPKPKGQKSTTPKLAAISYSKKQVWYGRVNDWKNMTVTRKDIEACVKYKVNGYMIEMAGDIPGTTYWKNEWTQSWINSIEKCYKELVKRTRAAGMWLFVSIVNDNMGIKKYGHRGIPLSKVMKQARQLVAIVKKYGPTGVIVQPVAETQTAAGREFEKYCKTQLKNFKLVNNNDGGQPRGINGMNFRAYHPASINTKVPKDAFTISDHGMIIRELAATRTEPRQYTYDILKKSNTWPSSTANKTKVNAWATNVFKKWGCRVLGFYAFQRIAHDANTIKIVGSIKR